MRSEWEGLESNIQLVVIYNFTTRWEKFLHNVALNNHVPLMRMPSLAATQMACQHQAPQ